MVPASAVILHIAKTRHFRKPYLDKGKAIDFPLADPTAGRHGAAKKTLIERASVKMYSQDGSGREEYYLKDLVRNIWSLLETLLDKNVKKEIFSKPEISATMRDFLHGWEYMDLVEESSPFRQKQTIISKNSGGWTESARDIDAIILFASGYEHITGQAKRQQQGYATSGSGSQRKKTT